MVRRGVGAADVGVTGGHVERVVNPSCLGAPHTTATRRPSAEKAEAAEAAVYRSVSQVDRNHLAPLNRIISVVPNADVNMVVENERRRISNLFVSYAIVQEHSDLRGFPDLYASPCVQGKEPSTAESGANGPVGSAEDDGVSTANFGIRSGGGYSFAGWIRDEA